MKNLALLLSFFVASSSMAQEIRCSVNINAPQLKSVSPSMFNTLETDLFEFVNNYQWTEDSFREDEKIECAININIVEELSVTEFLAGITIQAVRPVYQSDLKTVIFSHQDSEFQFTYIEGQALEFDELIFQSNLTAVIAFYLYTIVGLDYATFEENGGKPYFQKAKTIVDGASNTSYVGWKSFESRRNRYWLIDAFTAPNYKKCHRAYYAYHRLGLDLMHESVVEGRKGIKEAMGIMQGFQSAGSDAMIILLFNNAKTNELIKIFKDSSVSSSEQSYAREYFGKVDPKASSSFIREQAKSKSNMTRAPAAGSKSTLDQQRSFKQP